MFNGIGWLSCVLLLAITLGGCGGRDAVPDSQSSPIIATGSVQEAGAAAQGSRRALAIAAPGARLKLNEVRSFVYINATNTGTPGIEQLIAASPTDLIITGGGSYDAPLNRGASDPSGRKLILGYIDVTEAAPYSTPEFFAGATAPTWFGKLHPGFRELYSVQFWNPAWEASLLSRIDTIISRGYDGVFLDVLDGELAWLPGNEAGNPAYVDAGAAMAALLSRIRAYVDRKHLTQAFYLVGNNPSGIARNFPATLKYLDGIFNEWVYYGPSADDPFVSTYVGLATAQSIASDLAPVYNAVGVPVFGNDFPNPLDDQAAAFRSLEFYSSLGWVPSVIKDGSKAIFSTGPFMFMAVPSNRVVSGDRDHVNLLSGGTTDSAVLIGGDKGDTFLGGPGQNTIKGGAGNDLIYAHPMSATFWNLLTVKMAATIKNATTPSISIRINGRVGVATTPVRAQFGKDVQQFDLAITRTESISSLVIEVSGTQYVDQSNYSNVEILEIRYRGTAIDLAGGTFTNGASFPGYTYSNNGTVSFATPSFVNSPLIFPDTRSTIDGGGGRNSVVYRGPYKTYTVLPLPDGTLSVTSNATAEGPDSIRNVQRLVFTDIEVDLQAPPALSSERIFAYAAANYPKLFAGNPATGQYQQFDYMYYPLTDSFLAVDKTGGIWMLGSFTDKVPEFVGMAAWFVDQVVAWEKGASMRVGAAPRSTTSQ